MAHLFIKCCSAVVVRRWDKLSLYRTFVSKSDTVALWHGNQTLPQQFSNSLQARNKPKWHISQQNSPIITQNEGQLEQEIQTFSLDFIREMERTQNPVKESEMLARLPVTVERFFAHRSIAGERNLHNFNKLIRVCAVKNTLHYAEIAFKALKATGLQPNAYTYCAMITVCGVANNVDRAFELFEEMKLNNVERTYHIYGALTKACASNGQIDRAFSILDLMKTTDDLTSNEVIWTTLIHGCFRSKQLDRAWKTFDEFRTKPDVKNDAIFLNLMIRICAERLEVERAESFLAELEQYYPFPTKETFSSLIYACAKRVDYYEKAFEYYARLVAQGFIPDTYVFEALLLACARHGDLSSAYHLLSQMKDFHIPKDRLILNTVLSIIAHSQSLTNVNLLPRNLPSSNNLQLANATNSSQAQQDLASSATPLSKSVEVIKLSQEDRIELANNIIEEMKTLKLPIQQDTVNTLLTVYTCAHRIKRAEQFFDEITTIYGFSPDAHSYAHMLRLYCSTKRVDDALRIYKIMIENQYFIAYALYEKLIAVCANVGDIYTSHMLLDEMVMKGFKVSDKSRRMALGVLGVDALSTVGLDPEKYRIAKSPLPRLSFDSKQRKKMAIALSKDMELKDMEFVQRIPKRQRQ